MCCRFYVIGMLKPLRTPLTSFEFKGKIDEVCEDIKMATAPVRDFMTFLGLRSTIDWSPLWHDMWNMT